MIKTHMNNMKKYLSYICRIYFYRQEGLRMYKGRAGDGRIDILMDAKHNIAVLTISGVQFSSFIRPHLPQYFTKKASMRSDLKRMCLKILLLQGK